MARQRPSTPGQAITTLLPDGSLLSHTLFEDRMHFLRVVDTVAPEVLDALRRSVYPHQGDVAAQQKALAEWQERFHVTEEWVLDATRETLRVWWDRGAPERDGWEPSPIAAAFRFAVPNEYSVKMRGGLLRAGESPAQATKRMKAHTEEMVQARAQEVEATLREQGYQPLRDAEKDFTILARWQYQHWTLRRLADLYDFGELKTNDWNKRHTGIPGVRKARARAAELIGLNVRVGRQGSIR